MAGHNTPPDAIITGEGVELELPAATALSRIVSGLLDYGLIFGVWLFLGWATAPLLQDLNYAELTTLMVGSLAVFFWVIPALITGTMNGSSPGKALTKMRVVTMDGGTVSMQQAFIRATVGIVEIWLTLGLLAIAASFVSKRGQRFGDMAAGTYVVRWPKKVHWEPDVSMPPELASWANLAQSRALPTGLSLNIAEFLKSRDRLSPQAREAQSRALATASERFVSPPPPWGTHPELFLEAVTIIRYTVERQRYARVNERRFRLGERIGGMPYGLAEGASREHYR